MSIYLTNMDISPHLCILRNLRNLLNTRQLHTSPSSAVLMPFTDMFRWIDNLIIAWNIVNSMVNVMWIIFYWYCFSPELSNWCFSSSLNRFETWNITISLMNLLCMFSRNGKTLSGATRQLGILVLVTIDEHLQLRK